MKKYYEINIACRGAIDTHIFETQKEKNSWLVEYLTNGNGKEWGRKQYEIYVKERIEKNKKILPFQKYIFSIAKKLTRFTIRSRHETILIREKFFEKVVKNA